MFDMPRKYGYGNCQQPEYEDMKDKFCDISSTCCNGFVSEQFNLIAYVNSTAQVIVYSVNNISIRGTVKIKNLSRAVISFTVGTSTIDVGSNSEAQITSSNIQNVIISTTSQDLAKALLCFDIAIPTNDLCCPSNSNSRSENTLLVFNSNSECDSQSDFKKIKNSACDIASTCCNGFTKEQFTTTVLSSTSPVVVYETDGISVRGTVRIKNLSQASITFNVGTSSIAVEPRADAAITSNNILNVNISTASLTPLKAVFCFDMIIPTNDLCCLS